MGKKACCDKNAVKRGQWSLEEDRRLKSYIEEHGSGCGWVSLPQKAGLKRCGKSCRLRWLNYLRPGLKHGNYTAAEEKVICKLYSMIGSRWSGIAAQLPGRTDNDIKNHWNTQLKHKWEYFCSIYSPNETPTLRFRADFSQNDPLCKTNHVFDLPEIPDQSLKLTNDIFCSETSKSSYSSSSISKHSSVPQDIVLPNNNSKATNSSFLPRDQTFKESEEILNPPNSNPRCSSFGAQDQSFETNSDIFDFDSSSTNLLDELLDPEFQGVDPALDSPNILDQSMESVV